MSRDPHDGAPLDRYAVRQGALYQYVPVPGDMDDPPAVEANVPSGVLYSARGRWFTEERAITLLALADWAREASDRGDNFFDETLNALVSQLAEPVT